MILALNRRAALVALLASVPMASRTALTAGPFPAAIRRAMAADAAYRESGRLALAIQATGQALPSGWRAHRAALLRDRAEARLALHTLTPTTATTATDLVAYYRDRADASGDPVAHRAARRRLRKVFRRPGAVTCPIAAEAFSTA